MKNLNKEININKKFIVMFVLLNFIIMGMYYSYALFQVSVIQDNVVVIKTGTVNITTSITDLDSSSFTLTSGETKTVTVNLNSTNEGSIEYKMYYDVTSGISNFIVTSTEVFTDDIVEGSMTTSKTITFTFQNTGDNDLTISLGTQGGLGGYDIELKQGVELVLNTELGVPVRNAITTSVNNPTNTSCKTKVEEDGIIYISGTKDCIDFNYVWYSGKLWRITAIYPDGTMKMITDSAITTIAYGSDYNFYTDENNTSYMYQWLNEDFLDTLYNYENIIVTDYKWNATSGNGDITYKLPTTVEEGATLVSAPVGLLNSYEYYMAYKNASTSTNYLNIGYYWWLLNRYSTSSSYVWLIYGNGNSSNYLPTSTNGGRPSINLKSTIQLSGGSGTKTDPYKIKGDKEEAVVNTTLLNTRTSGEYVTFAGEDYRIVGTEVIVDSDTNEEKTITKLNKLDYIRDESDTVVSKKFASSVTFGLSTNTQSDDYWDYYLNNTWKTALDDTYEGMLVEGTYYLGKVISSNKNYKLSICQAASNTVTTKDCEKTTSTWTGFVGLPRYGEMFASQQGSGSSSSSSMWLITPYSSSNVWIGNTSGSPSYNDPWHTFGGRPSINLTSEIVITGGKGTPISPYEITLPETE